MTAGSSQSRPCAGINSAQWHYLTLLLPSMQVRTALASRQSSGRHLSCSCCIGCAGLIAYAYHKHSSIITCSIAVCMGQCAGCCRSCCCRVTNCPHIHSRGFHFAFDLDQHPEMGYVLPTWVGDKHLQPTLLESLQGSAVARLLQQQQPASLGMSPEATPGTDAAALVATAAASDLPAGAALSRLLGPSNMTLLHLPLKPGSEDVGQLLAHAAVVPEAAEVPGAVRC